MDQKLKQFASPRQIEFLEAVDKYGSNRAAARELGVCSTTVDRSINVVKKRAALAGYNPETGHTKLLPPAQVLRGTSTLYGKNGEMKLQWVKSKLDLDKQLEIIKEAAEAYYKEIPKIEVPKGPKKFDTDIISWFQVGDAHLGMLAHEAETGANFDLKIAEQEICTAVSILFDECEPHERCVVNDLGDFTHYENFAAVTEASGHALDFDSRFPKMVHVYSRIMRYIVEKALEKFKHVDVIINQGNHSRTNDIWMAELLRSAYGHSKRVHVLDNSSVFIPYRMGNTFVMVHHSDKVRMERLVQVMCNNFRQDWGESKFRYIDVGHHHHKVAIKEDSGATVEMWNTLAAKDKYTHDHGWQARQSITRVDRSKTYGEVGRRLLPIEEVYDRLKNARDHERPPERRKVYTV